MRKAKTTKNVAVFREALVFLVFLESQKEPGMREVGGEQKTGGMNRKGMTE